MKADGSLKSLLQGVSQQPTRDRLPGQCTEQINMNADPVRGLSRRPGDDLVGSLGVDADIRGWGNIVTPDGQQCLVKVTGTDVRVFNYNAVEFPVTITGTVGYLSTAGRWSMTTLKDKSYLANEGIITQMSTANASYWNLGDTNRPSGIIQILGGAYGKEYSVSIDNVVVATISTPDGSDPAHVKYVGTTVIAEQLVWAMEHDISVDTPPAGLPAGATFYPYAEAALATGWTITRKDDIIYLRKTSDAVAFEITVSDDAGNINAKGMSDSVPDIADLPRYAPHNYVVRVAQETDQESDLWLKFVSNVAGATSGSNFGQEGAWYEALKPGLSVGVSKATLPRILTFDTGTQEFTLSQEDWEDREVGTDKTNPVPSFIGYGISDVSSFQSRLVFLAGPSVVASRSKKFENFWIGSASTLTDADPLDMTSQAAQASTLKYAVAHNKDLVIFSSKGQFVLFGRSAVTPANAALVLTTSFEADLSAEPTPCGRNVFFGTRYGRFTGIREFYTEGGTDINDTRPITQHVKQYLLGSVSHLSSTSNYDTLVVHTDNDKSKVYPYQFIWQNNEKVQSAWSTWTFPKNVLYSFFDDEIIYFVIDVAGEQFLLRMTLDITEEEAIGYPLHLSCRFDVPGVNTQFVLPFDWLFDQPLRMVQGDGCPNPGLSARIESIVFDVGEDGYVVTLKDDMQGGDLVGGIKFRSEYWPTMPRMKDRDGVVISNARLMITQFLLSLEETGNIIGQRVTKWGDGAEVPFEGYVVNDVGSIVGQAALTDFTFHMPFKDRSDRGAVKFFTDEHWPMTILDIEWEGTINKRGKRLSSGEAQ